jgi:LacI family transcriptional regulator
MCKSFIKVASESGNTAFEIPDDIISSDSIRLGEWLAMLPVPVACFCTSDYLARRVANAFINIGREIPESAGVLGVGDSLLNSVLAPQMLSSIVLPEREIGRTAASLIIEMFNEPKTVPISWKLPPTRIITRESTAIARYRDEVVNNAISYMMTHLFSMSGIEELAHICGVSKRNLEARFKNVLGRAPAQEWRQRRHREVCRLLSETNISLGDIARMSGYAEPSNFWNAFKKLEGITPARYRASNR